MTKRRRRTLRRIKVHYRSKSRFRTPQWALKAMKLGPQQPRRRW